MGPLLGRPVLFKNIGLGGEAEKRCVHRNTGILQTGAGTHDNKVSRTSGVLLGAALVVGDRLRRSVLRTKRTVAIAYNPGNSRSAAVRQG